VCVCVCGVYMLERGLGMNGNWEGLLFNGHLMIGSSRQLDGKWEFL